MCLSTVCCQPCAATSITEQGHAFSPAANGVIGSTAGRRGEGDSGVKPNRKRRPGFYSQLRHQHTAWPMASRFSPYLSFHIRILN